MADLPDCRTFTVLGLDQVAAAAWAAARESPPGIRTTAMSEWLQGLVAEADQDDRYLMLVAGAMWRAGLLASLPMSEECYEHVWRLSLCLRDHVEHPGFDEADRFRATWWQYSWEQVGRLLGALAQEAQQARLRLGLRRVDT